MREAKKDNPGVIVPPPAIYGPCLLIGLALDYLRPIPVLPDRGQYLAGFILIALSFILAGWVLLYFHKAQTSFDAHKPTTAVITAGPFRFSRNPVYPSLTMLYVGIAIAADSIWILGLLAPAYLLTHYGVILREERYLEKKFGEEYRRHKASVRR